MTPMWTYSTTQLNTPSEPASIPDANIYRQPKRQSKNLPPIKSTRGDNQPQYRSIRSKDPQPMQSPRSKSLPPNKSTNATTNRYPCVVRLGLRGWGPQASR